MLGFGFDLVGFPAATRYMRLPSAFSDISVKPSFLRTTPAKKPRTECCCHPVAFMIAAIVVPLVCLSSPRTVSCLVPPRVVVRSVIDVRFTPDAIKMLRGSEMTRFARRRHLAMQQETSLTRSPLEATSSCGTVRPSAFAACPLLPARRRRIGRSYGVSPLTISRLSMWRGPWIGGSRGSLAQKGYLPDPRWTSLEYSIGWPLTVLFRQQTGIICSY